MAKRQAKLVLASASSARRRLLKRLGRAFVVRPANVDEDAVKQRIREPRKLVMELSRLKARSVAATLPGSIVIGSDQVLVCRGRVYGKPYTESRARAQLAAFSGKMISLLTGVCVIDRGGREHVFVHETRMKFRRLTASEIASYVRADRPLDCAGSFKFEQRGIDLFEAVRTDDPSAIEGLPLIKLSCALRMIS